MSVLVYFEWSQLLKFTMYLKLTKAYQMTPSFIVSPEPNTLHTNRPVECNLFLS